jgi:Vault protein inter-alpha-trypsin domain
MKKWTEAAEMRLEQYLQERVEREQMHGEEAAELKDDLRRHIHEEISNDPIGTCGLMELENALGRLDAGYTPHYISPAASLPPKKKSKFKKGSMWLFAVYFPLGIVLFEWVTNFCGSVFFETIPTVAHGLLLLAVPLLHAWLLRTMERPKPQQWKWRAMAAGLCFGVSLFYALLFLPLVPASCFALILFGMGLLSLSPIFTWICSFRIYALEKNQATAHGLKNYKRMWFSAFLVAFGALCLHEVPALWTRHQVARYFNDEETISQSALQSLRTYHSSDTLLGMCYDGSGFRSGSDISTWISSSSWNVIWLDSGFRSSNDTTKVRDLYFRVTGVPFNAQQPPHWLKGSSLTSSRNSDVWEQDDLDFDLGGDVVAAKVKHLDCKESRFDGHLDAKARIGYGEWTLVFQNTATIAKEARCQMRLPSGGQVSRLTLWINGEPREAAFGSVAQVKAAYKEIAVVQRRDPVLVNMVGPDTIMVQCFPVPARGEMKIRIGITAPLEGDTWRLPYITEKNFGDISQLQHALWMQADKAFSCIDAPQTSHVDGDMQSISFGSKTMKLHMKLNELPKQPTAVWCEDRFADTEQRFLIGAPHSSALPAMEKIIVVVDGSKALGEHREWIARALKEKSVSILLANEYATKISADEIAKHDFRGGCDNEPALYEALRQAKESANAAVVWLHGPQPVLLCQSERLLQLLERGSNRPKFFALPVVDGANRLFEALGRSGMMSSAPSDAGSEAGLAAWMDRLHKGEEKFSWQWSRQADATNLTENRVSDQLARLWAMEEVAKSKDGKLAVKYQLVSYVSGAVVLETMEQYARHGLNPVDATSTPTMPNVPEPSTALLILLGSMMACLRRRR